MKSVNLSALCKILDWSKMYTLVDNNSSVAKWMKLLLMEYKIMEKDKVLITSISSFSILFVYAMYMRFFHTLDFLVHLTYILY